MTFLNKNEFRNLYGERTTAIARRLERLYQKSVKIGQHIGFLQNCKKLNLIPRGMHLKNVTSIRKNEHLKNAMIKIRNNTLESQYKNLRLNNIDIKTQQSILKIYMIQHHQERDHSEDLTSMNKNGKNIKDKIKVNHKTKINMLVHLRKNQQI